MKYIFLSLFLIFTLSSSQSPIPIPRISLLAVQGYWYLPWAYNFNPKTGPNTCVGFNIITGLQEGVLNQYSLYKDQFESSFDQLDIRSSNSTWNIQGKSWYLIGFDPINSSWAILASSELKMAYLLSRNQSISSLVVTAAIALLNQEGFNVNQQNSGYLNQSCPQLNEFNGNTAHPIPVQNFNGSIVGNWYVSWGSTIRGLPYNNELICIQFNIFALNNPESLAVQIISNGDGINTDNTISLSSTLNPGVWISNGWEQFYLIAFDTVDYQWGLIGTLNRPATIMLLTKSLNIDPTVVSNAASVAKSQGYDTSTAGYFSINCSLPQSIPMSNLNLEKVSGYWYVVWALNNYNSYYPNYQICQVASILISEDLVDVNIYVKVAGTNQPMSPSQDPISYSQSSSGNWTQIYVLAADEVQYQWLLLNNMGSVLLLSQTPSISSSVVSTVSTILTQQGYYIDSSNSGYMDTNCTFNITPNPVAVNNLQLSSMSGLWYMTWVANYPWYQGYCITQNMSFEGNNVSVNQLNYYQNTLQQNITTSYEVELGNDAIWLDDSDITYLVAVDEADYQWAVFATLLDQQVPSGGLLTRSSSTNNTLISQAKQLLESQGYQITQQNILCT